MLIITCFRSDSSCLSFDYFLQRSLVHRRSHYFLCHETFPNKLQLWWLENKLASWSISPIGWNQLTIQEKNGKDEKKKKCDGRLTERIGFRIDRNYARRCLIFAPIRVSNPYHHCKSMDFCSRNSIQSSASQVAITFQRDLRGAICWMGVHHIEMLLMIADGSSSVTAEADRRYCRIAQGTLEAI